MKYLSILFLIFSVVIASCSNDDNPTPPSTQYRISFIYSDETTQLFDYNSEGNVTGWHCLETASSQIIADASYSYSTDGSSVKIGAEVLQGDQKWVFEEHLCFNFDGAAKSSDGVAGLYRVKNDSLLMKKRYSVAFNYNNLKQLESIQTEEKRIIDNGDDYYTLKWNVALVWNNNNLIECREFSNPAFPWSVYEYSYYDIDGVDYAPIIQYPIFRAYYLPLQYQGRFGAQPVGLVKRATLDNNYTFEYSYNIASTVTNSIVEEYFEKSPSGNETKYTIGWE